MRCFDEGRLRAYLDGETDSDERATIAAHLGDCAACARRLADQGAAAAATSNRLAAWLPTPTSSGAVVTEEQRASAALARFQATIRSDARDDGVASRGWFDQMKEQMTQMMARLSAPRRRPALAAVAMVAILGLVLTLSPVSSLADQLFRTFRVQQFAAVAVRVPGMTQMPQAGSVTPEQYTQLIQMLAPLGTPTTDATKDTVGEAANVDAARAFLAQHGAALKVPGQLPAGYEGFAARYGTAKPTTSSYVLNVAVAKQYLALSGSPELNALPWPTKADGTPVEQLTFGLQTPAAVATIYGDEAQQKAIGLVQMANLPNAGPGAGPALTLPNELDVNAFRTALLALPGLPQDTVEQIRNIEDWERTLIIPVPEDATTENVTIKGNAGLLIVDGQGRGSFVVWQENGMLFAAGGTVGKAELMAFANSLR